MERMRDELSRARRRGVRILTPEEATSPMDLNPTLEVSAAIIADCVNEAERYRRNNPDVTMADPEPESADVIDDGMRRVADGRGPRPPHRETA